MPRKILMASDGQKFVDFPEVLEKKISLSIWFLNWQDQSVTRASAGPEKPLDIRPLTLALNTSFTPNFKESWGRLVGSTYCPGSVSIIFSYVSGL